MVAAPVEVPGLNVTLRLQQNGKPGSDVLVYSGEAQLTPNEWQDVSFRIKDFVSLTDSDIDLMKIWIKTTDGQSPDGEYGIWLDNIVLHTKSSASVIIVILWVLLIMILLVLAAYSALYIRAQYIRRKRRDQMELRRRKQLRMQAMQQNRSVNPPPYSQNPNSKKRHDEFR